MKIAKLFLFSLLFWACQSEILKPNDNDTKPNYNLVFNNKSLDEIAISVAPADWRALQDNLRQVINTDTVASDRIESKLLVIPALVRFQDGVWNNVGLKFYTSKNLLDGYKLNDIYLPLELDFDYFATKFPETANQKFYGFSNLILDNQALDFSKIRQVLVNEMLNELQITTTKNSLKKVKFNIGSQSQMVIYTLKEKVDTDLIKNRFNEDNFNLYRTKSKLDKFIISDFTRLQNGYLPGFGDVQRLINAANRRNSPYNQEFDPFSGLNTENNWKTSLEFAFDNQMFIRWMALNTTVGNDQFNMVHQEPYYIFSGTKTKTNFFYTFPHNSLGLGYDATMPNTEILNATVANPLVANIKNDPDYYLNFETEVALIRKKYFTTTYLYPIIDRYYNQMRLAAIGNTAVNVPQIEDIEALKLWIKQRIETLNRTAPESQVLQ